MLKIQKQNLKNQKKNFNLLFFISKILSKKKLKKKKKKL